MRVQERARLLETIMYTRTQRDPSNVEPTLTKKRAWWKSTELSTEGQQESDPTQPKHGRSDRLDPKREMVPDGLVEPLVVEEDDEGGEDPEEVHYRHDLFG